MKRILSFILSINLIFILVPGTVLAAPSWPSAVSIEADGGILMEAQTGTVLFAKNEDQPYYPASITKILTALIVLEHCSLDEEVTFSHDDVYNVEAGSSTAGIDEGDVLTVRDCLYALMLASANESANALACHVSGSREAFAELMNQTAESLGCTGSHFANPSGLNDENHYTTAHDMALITRAAIQNPDFLEIDGARNYKLPPTKRNLEGGYVANHHRMLVKNTSVYYPGAFAGKTGYTSIAGEPVVAKGDRVLVGQKIAEAGGFVSAPIHASVSGTVKDIKPMATPSGAMVKSIIIENDGLYEEDPSIGKDTDYESFSNEKILEKVKEAGIVGLGGAGFPNPHSPVSHTRRPDRQAPPNMPPYNRKNT